MPNHLSLEQLIFVLTVVIFIAVLLLIAFWLEHQKYQKILELNSRASLQEARKKSSSIIHKALLHAQKILGKAGTESVELISETQAVKERLEAQYKSEFAKYFEALKLIGEKAQAENQALIKQQADTLFIKFEKDLSAFLATTEQKSITAMEAELKNMRQIIDEYKRAQLGIIDENIISMLERTLSLVMAKKITLKDELDLVYEALDKAKAEKFIV